MKENNHQNCLLCNSSAMKTIEELHTKPLKETDFLIAKDKYRRTIRKCETCGIYLNQHDYDLDLLYKKNYNERTYTNNLSKHFDIIMSLPYSKSDNKQRVERINNYLIENSKHNKRISVLDIGSGLCVFLAELKKYYNDVTCIDPSYRSIRHAKNYVGITNAIEGSFGDFIFNQKYDLITLNKVLEHITDPLKTLKKAKSLLNDNGIIYVEVPDGYNASKNGGYVDREEFYIEHFTIFNQSSLNFLAKSVNLECIITKEIHEPSDKYSIYSFMKPRQ
ncbi:MAG: class I SAM-dependent methyltransferase [Candidatus Neomarinimicrobiota bacterium]